jgi:hypothetical protein
MGVLYLTGVSRVLGWYPNWDIWQVPTPVGMLYHACGDDISKPQLS